jgi:DNA-binding transcriptional LysR family regulator
MDRLEAMSILVCAVEKGSLSAAARALRIPLPTVSRKVAELEGRLKASLVIRSRAGLHLTQAGQAYVESARAILADVAAAERRASGEYTAPTGHLEVASPVVFGRLHVVPVTAGFLAAYPDVDVRLGLSDRLTQMTDENIDCAIRIGELPDSGLTAVRLGEVRRVLCASPAYIEKHGTPKSLRELERHACITAEAFGLPQRWSFGRGRHQTSVAIRSRLSVNTVEAALDAAIAGVGLTCALSYQVAGAVKRGALTLLLTGAEPRPWPVHLLHKPQARLPLKLRAYLDFAAPRLRQRLCAAALDS